MMTSSTEKHLDHVIQLVFQLESKIDIKGTERKNRE